MRPVEWLLSSTPVDRRWCLVHATHLDDAERIALAPSGAVAGLCPTTEANLGDGVFPAAAFLGDRGRWGIGSDSHASVDAAEELRWLEYTQRLAQQRRNVLTGSTSAQVADHLWLGAVAGGTRASGGLVDGQQGLAVGARADFVVLDTTGALAGLTPAQALASHVFANHRHATIRDVWARGIHRIHDGRHAAMARATERFVAARRDLLDEV
jgi:formimidoylglutamate deiminase